MWPKGDSRYRPRLGRWAKFGIDSLTLFSLIFFILMHMSAGESIVVGLSEDEIYETCMIRLLHYHLRLFDSPRSVVFLLQNCSVEKKPSHRRGDVNIFLGLKSPFHFFFCLVFYNPMMDTGQMERIDQIDLESGEPSASGELSWL